MVKIVVKNMRIHNFQSFVSEELDFSATRRLVLIKGINQDTTNKSAGVVEETSNGSGKSAIAHALMFALFGQLDGKFHNDNIRNNSSDTVVDGFRMFVDVEVDTVVSDEDIRHWKIVRGLQKGTSTVLEIYAWTDHGTWSDISKSSVANSQKFIDENILLMNFDMFQRLVMLSVEDKYNFFKLSAGGKRDFVELMFDTSIYSQMYKQMFDDLKAGNAILQNLKANQLKLAKTKEVCEEDIRKYKDDVQGRIDALEKDAADMKVEMEAIDPQLTGLKEQEKVVKEALEIVRKDKEKLNSALKMCQDQITTHKIDSSKCASTITHHEKELNKHKDVLSMICDDCRKVVDKFYSLDVYRNEIDALKQKIAAHDAEISTMTGKMEKVREIATKKDAEEVGKITELSDIQVQERNLQFQKSQISSSILKLESQITDLQNAMEDEAKIPSFKIYTSTLEEIAAVEHDLKEEGMRLCLLKVGSEIVSPEAIKRNIISRMVASINALINANLSELAVGFTCNLTPDMNDWDLKSTLNGGDLDFTLLSKGEQMKLIISSQMAFRRFLMSRFNVGMNIMIIDEVVDRNMDSVSIRKLLGMLLQLSQKENTNISIISHRAEVETMFDELTDTQTLVVQKENGISRILRD